MLTENSLLKGSNNRLYRIGRELGSGGEGRVFTVQGQLLAVKIYKKQSLLQEEKLRYMVSHPVPDLTGKDGLPIVRIAWPRDIVYDNLGNFVGYVMPLIEGGVEIFEVHRCCTSPKAKNLFPNYSWKLNVTVAKNLAMSVDYLHRHKCVIGDMNCKNILVDENGAIIFLDVDSFDIRNEDNGAHYKCCAGTEDYLPPELQHRDLRSELANFDYLTDDFALAIHVFQLLMDNYHPFSCRKTVDTKDSTSYNARLDQIGDGQCPYINKYPNVDIPLGAPRIREILPEYIENAFRNTFDYNAFNALSKRGQRTPAAKWVADLERLCEKCNNDGLVRCKNNPKHEFLYSVGYCGHCAAQARLPNRTTFTKQSNDFEVVTSSGKHGGNAVFSNEETRNDLRSQDKIASNSEANKKPIPWLFPLVGAALAIVILGISLSKDKTSPSVHPKPTPAEVQYQETTVPSDTADRIFYHKDELSIPTTGPEETVDERVSFGYKGGTYYGYAENGVPQGEGVWTLAEGEYEGFFEDGYPNGYGTFTYFEYSVLGTVSGYWSYGSAQTQYTTGEWRGKRCGTYYGMLMNDEPHGIGELSLDYGGQYVGTFYDGWPGGVGSYSYNNGATTRGYWSWGTQTGKLHASRDGCNLYYEGMFCDGEPNGYGAFSLEKCGTFYGEFVKGKVDGWGIYVYREPVPPNQPTIEGDSWTMLSKDDRYENYYYGLGLDGKWQGFGLGIMYKSPYDSHYVGEVRNDYRQGFGRLYTGNDLYQEGIYNEGYLIK